MKALRFALVSSLVYGAATIAGAEVCTATSNDVRVEPSYTWGETVPQVFFPPAPVGWLYTFDGGPFEFDVRLTIEKYEDDPLPPCVIPVGAWFRLTIEVTNLSDIPYRTAFSGNGRWWEVFLYDAHSMMLERRMSHHQPYDDDTYHANIGPGETQRETRVWFADDFHGPHIPAGVYRAFGRFEGTGSTPPVLTHRDTTLAPGLTITFVEDKSSFTEFAQIEQGPTLRPVPRRALSPRRHGSVPLE